MNYRSSYACNLIPLIARNYDTFHIETAHHPDFLLLSLVAWLRNIESSRSLLVKKVLTILDRVGKGKDGCPAPGSEFSKFSMTIVLFDQFLDVCSTWLWWGQESHQHNHFLHARLYINQLLKARYLSMWCDSIPWQELILELPVIQREVKFLDVWSC